MQFFVIDVGNTSTKWALANPKKILSEKEFPTKLFLGSTAPRLSFPKNVSGAIISSVVPKAIQSIRKILIRIGVANPIIVSSKLDLGIGIRYPNPRTIGADRLVNAVAAIEIYGAPAVVVDFGTAVTFDVISKKREYLGGVIAPGLRFMTHYLHEKTALLPHISLSEPRSSIGKNTVHAMRVGAVVGYRGLVREILHSIARDMKLKSQKQLKVIATGGHSRLIASKIPEIQFVDQQLTLQGLRILYLKNL
jgi:type III pantothenate kinase